MTPIMRKRVAQVCCAFAFLLFVTPSWAANGSAAGQHWSERSKQRSWSTNWNRNYQQHKAYRNQWAGGEWDRWRRNNYYYSYGWGSPYYDYAWYGYQRPYYTTYWDSYPSTFVNYTYPSYPYDGKWYTGSWASRETPTQAYRNTGYYSGSP